MKVLLVNQTHPLPPDYISHTVPIVGAEPEQADIFCIRQLSQMLTDCQKAGLNPVVLSAWRSRDRQAAILKESIDAGIAAGMTDAEALERALLQVAFPGTSEHETGLAFDIVDKSDMESQTEKPDESPAQRWLISHCWDYGFILRYPAGKESITGYRYEPWHYRYIGREHSLRMKETGLCLEEYAAMEDDAAMEDGAV